VKDKSVEGSAGMGQTKDVGEVERRKGTEPSAEMLDQRSVNENSNRET
jgi:hypothetical protein